MSDFPRGWTLSVESNGGTASITVPAIAGVVHVLDSFSVKIVNTTAAAQGEIILLNSSDGVFTNFFLARLFALATGADSASASGLDLAAGPGASLTIAFGGGVAGLLEDLLIQGHDI